MTQASDDHLSFPTSEDPAFVTRVLSWQHRLLKALLESRDLQGALEALIRQIEALNPGVICSIMRLLDNRLFFAAGPSLPPLYHEAVDGVEIGDGVGSCGTAAYRNETVVVDNIFTDPTWTVFRPLMATVGLASCWSEPVRGQSGRVLGTFAIYRRVPHAPCACELEQISVFAQVAGTLIDFANVQQARRLEDDRLRLLASNIPGTVFEFRMTRDGTMSFPYVSPGIRSLTGLSLGPVIPDARNFLDLASDETRPGLLHSLQHSFVTLDPWIEVFALRRSGGVRWVRGLALPRREADGSVAWAGIFLDVTQEKQAGDHLATTHAALQRSARDLGDLISMMAHDLRAPLRRVSGFLTLLERRLEILGDPEALEILRYALRETAALDGPLTSLLDRPSSPTA